jgi:hypothetical protein
VSVMPPRSAQIDGMLSSAISPRPNAMNAHASDALCTLSR